MAKKSVKKTSRSSKPRVAVITGRFNEFITEKLMDGCLDELNKHGIPSKNITSCWVPGSFELPVTALKFAKKKSIDAVICLGAVIRGETFHFDLVAQQAASGIMQVSLQTAKPVIFGVITTDTIDQAYKRSEEKGDNKGREAALVALEMIGVLKSV